MFSARQRIGVVALLVGLVAFFYVTGRLDTLLYRFGLNHNPCTHVLGGGITCGPDVAGTPYGSASESGGGAGPAGPSGVGGVPAGTANFGHAVSGSAGRSGGSLP